MLVSCDFIEFSEFVHSCHFSSGVARLHNQAVSPSSELQFSQFGILKLNDAHSKLKVHMHDTVYI